MLGLPELVVQPIRLEPRSCACSKFKVERQHRLRIAQMSFAG